MRFGICARFQHVAALQAYPFDYLEEAVQRFLVPEQPEEDFEDLLREARRLPVPIEAANSLLPARLALVETPTQSIDRPRIQRYMQTTLQRAEQAGIRLLVFGSGGARHCPPDYALKDAVQQIGEHLATWSEWAKQHGIEIVLEPLQYAETNTLNTVAEGGELVASIEHSGARLLADTYHMAANKEDPESLFTWGSLLSHVHVAELEDRAAPGHHGDDFRPYFSALQRAGYDQRISIECKWQDLSQEVPTAIAILREHWATSTTLSH
ncbi:sugar phosphate isomerase/epimerase family protein [Tengunoibacter tsumagoiensis]|uniref:Xylose isomerase-like TIM barrel domain-containing protein n=1 Tax=Tengunoibacter tsumagoiensis TaxID=2014871 RepID=A0A402A1H8_9CHLR|nr:sugar phosphate isomerase/epimerase family protein [Tengunoibacter tsumagoiensis]GCE12915.1 hypothetical protein KTT_27740 [Tengunoibacter tsumagoiensis]